MNDDFMNELTKEELEEIVEMISDFFYSRKEPKEVYSLRNKIQSMIDNYCEHEWRKGIHLFNDIYCTKCKQHFEVNNEA